MTMYTGQGEPVMSGLRADAATPNRAKVFSKRLLLAVCLCLLSLLLTACAADRGSAYDKAVAIFGKGDYDAAAAAFDKLGDYQQAATYAAYSHGLVLYEQGDYTAAEPYFAKTQDFMYGKQRTFKITFFKKYIFC